MRASTNSRIFSPVFSDNRTLSEKDVQHMWRKHVEAFADQPANEANPSRFMRELRGRVLSIPERWREEMEKR